MTEKKLGTTQKNPWISPVPWKNAKKMMLRHVRMTFFVSDLINKRMIPDSSTVPI
jgi:hypothetical protein